MYAGGPALRFPRSPSPMTNFYCSWWRPLAIGLVMVESADARIHGVSEHWLRQALMTKRLSACRASPCSSWGASGGWIIAG